MRQHGFTLIETMLAVAILAIMFAIGPQIITQINKFYLLSRARIDLQRESRVALSMISKTLNLWY
ncbi:MAG: prepilin-type N-terminal cleavage/methylation domain-containing protein [Elusimicrobiota bacterium]